MAQLPITHLETHPDGTTGIAGIVNGNWERLEAIFNPALSSADSGYGAFWKAVVRDPTTPTNGHAIVWDTAFGRPKFAAVSGQSITTAIQALVPYVYWPLNETSGTVISDASGNARHATLSGTHTKAQTNVDGTATAFTFTAARITANAVWNHTDWSMVCWVKPTFAAPGHAPTLFAQREGSSPIRLSTHFANLRTGIESWNGAATGTVTMPLTDQLAMNEWYHVVLTRDAASGRMRVYVNGRLMGGVARPLGAATDRPLTFGATTVAFGEPWIGSASHLAYFDRVLSEREIFNLWLAK